MSRKTILITGASRGIGRAIALALAAPDVRLVLAARSAGALEEVCTVTRQAGANAQPVVADLTQEDEVQGLVTTAAAGSVIDVVVHSVGAALVAPLEKISLTDWEQHLRTQLTSLFLVCKYAVAHMQPGGLIVNISSVAARQAFPGWSAYTAAKHGAQGFTAAIREELRPRGIRVSAVHLAATDTSLWDSVPGEWNRGNMLQPAEVAAQVAVLINSPPHLTVEEISLGHVAGRL